MSRSLVVISFLVVALLNHYEITRERLQTCMYLCDFTALQTLQKISVLPDRTDRIISVRFRFGPYTNFGPVRSGKYKNFGLRSFRFGPNRPNAQPQGWGIDHEEFGVNLKPKQEKGNDRFHETNNNKENETGCFPFPLSVTPNQTTPYRNVKMGYFYF